MKSILLFLMFLLLGMPLGCAQNGFEILEYYPIADRNTWRYDAPEGWKDGDYISRIVADTANFQNLIKSGSEVKVPESWKVLQEAKSFFHFDAIKSAKLLKVKDGSIYYMGESFGSDGSFALFDKPILWFKNQGSIGSKMDETSQFIRYYTDGKQTQGIFYLTQHIKEKEEVTVPNGTFTDCLRIEFETHWDFGKGSEAKSINVYHYAKDVGVVKASARFILFMNSKELVNRLVEPEMKSYELH